MKKMISLLFLLMLFSGLAFALQPLPKKTDVLKYGTGVNPKYVDMLMPKTHYVTLNEHADTMLPNGMIIRWTGITYTNCTGIDSSLEEWCYAHDVDLHLLFITNYKNKKVFYPYPYMANPFACNNVAQNNGFPEGSYCEFQVPEGETEWFNLYLWHDNGLFSFKQVNLKITAEKVDVNYSRLKDPNYKLTTVLKVKYW